MLRASYHLSFFSLPSLFSTSFHSKPYYNLCSSPSIPRKLVHSSSIPISSPPSFPSFNWNPTKLSSKPRLGSRVCFSAGSGGMEKKELLVQHILVPEDNQMLLLELQKRVAEGEDLSDLAVEYSICPSKENGGMLGWIRRGQMVPEFEEAAFNAPLNKIVRCKTSYGWHLLQVVSEREESVLQEIDPKELHSKLQDPQFVEEAQLIDVREPEEWSVVNYAASQYDPIHGLHQSFFGSQLCGIYIAQASLPGFKVLPLRQFGTWGSLIAEEFDPQKDTYVLCHHGVRSLQVANWLHSQGFKRVFNVAGGIHAYAVKADPSVPTY